MEKKNLFVNGPEVKKEGSDKTKDCTFLYQGTDFTSELQNGYSLSEYSVESPSVLFETYKA